MKITENNNMKIKGENSMTKYVNIYLSSYIFSVEDIVYIVSNECGIDILNEDGTFNTAYDVIKACVEDCLKDRDCTKESRDYIGREVYKFAIGDNPFKEDFINKVAEATGRELKYTNQRNENYDKNILNQSYYYTANLSVILANEHTVEVREIDGKKTDECLDLCEYLNRRMKEIRIKLKNGKNIYSALSIQSTFNADFFKKMLKYDADDDTLRDFESEVQEFNGAIKRNNKAREKTDFNELWKKDEEYIEKCKYFNYDYFEKYVLNVKIAKIQELLQFEVDEEAIERDMLLSDGFDSGDERLLTLNAKKRLENPLDNYIIE